jgi:hypothetical protein
MRDQTWTRVADIRPKVEFANVLSVQENSLSDTFRRFRADALTLASQMVKDMDETIYI